MFLLQLFMHLNSSLHPVIKPGRHFVVTAAALEIWSVISTTLASVCVHAYRNLIGCCRERDTALLSSGNQPLTSEAKTTRFYLWSWISTSQYAGLILKYITRIEWAAHTNKAAHNNNGRIRSDKKCWLSSHFCSSHASFMKSVSQCSNSFWTTNSTNSSCSA